MRGLEVGEMKNCENCHNVSCPKVGKDKIALCSAYK